MIYKEISKSFLSFNADYLLNYTCFKKWFAESIESGYIDVAKLKLEILEANQLNSFSWKKLAHEKNFVYYHKDATEAEIFLDFQLLIWEVLYPEIILSEDSVPRMKEWFMYNLPTDKWIEVNEIIKALKKNKQEWGDINNLILINFRRDKANSLLDIKREYGTDKTFFRLYSIEEQQLSLRERCRLRRKSVRKRGKP